MPLPMTYTPRTRLFIDAPLTAGASVAASDAHAHYLVNVMRMKAGGSVALFNGQDGEWEATVAIPAKRRVDFTITKHLRIQGAEADLWLAFAPVKRIEFLAEKAPELGAAALLPVFTRRT